MTHRQSKLNRAFLLLGILFGLSSLTNAQEPRPVARLISANTDVYTRPRHSEPTVDSEVASPTLTEASIIERRAFELTNEARAKNGLAPLSWDSELCRMAREHSQRMARENFFSHETPEGRRLKDRARGNGIARFRVLAENIAFNKGFSDPGAFAVERWMISAGHRANILHSGFEASAVGVFVSDDGAVYLTQAFIAR
jgi:uncharacterized protein YkwD